MTALEHNSPEPSTQVTPTSDILSQPVANSQPLESFAQPKATQEPVLYIFANYIRIILKCLMLFYLWYIGQPIIGNALLFVMTEAGEWLNEYFYRKKQVSKTVGAAISSFLSVAVIHVFLLQTGMVTEFYLLYIVHYTSALSRFSMVGSSFALVMSLISFVVLRWGTPVGLPTLVHAGLLILIGWRLTDLGRYINELSLDRKRALAIDKMKNDFIAIISHNLRTPIAALKGYSSLLLRSDAGPLSEDQRQIIERIGQNNARLEEVAEEIISLSIMEAKNYTITKNRCNYEKLISDIIIVTKPKADEKKITLTYTHPTEALPELLIDERKIGLVLTSILDNAIKFTSHGGVTVTVTRNENTVITTIADTGIGIPAEQLATLFQKFNRVGSVMVYDFKGAGLGLYISKTIIDLHGGKIWAQAHEGQGTTVSFSLPITTV